MHYQKIDKFDTANGEGIRVSFWVSGCSFGCKGCHNSGAWSYKSGEEYTNETLRELLEAADAEHIAGLSILGGEPLAPRNVEQVAIIAGAFKRAYPQKTLWLWTGYTMHEIIERITSQTSCADALESITKDVDRVIDGRYDSTQPTQKAYRGSDNQMMWMKKDGLHIEFKLID